MKYSNEKLVDVVHPICCLQKIAIYETKTRFYLVGSNNAQTRYRILKIDRTEPTEINVIDDKVEYNYSQIRDLLKRIDVGNRPKASKSYDKGSNSGMVHHGYAFGILGFIKFLEGYYMVLISKRRRVAVIGGHAIYKIDDTDILPIGSKVTNPDETKYLRIFQNVDLSSNFYFSYSYDLTRTLQYNLAPYYGLPAKFSDNHKVYEKETETEKERINFHTIDELVEDSKDLDLDSIFNFNKIPNLSNNVELSSLSANMFPDIGSPPNEYVNKCKKSGKVFRGEPTEKYVWNSYLLKDLKERVHPDWLLNITHGFVGQSNICVYGKPLYVTLIARRSNKFAGTRFLKRGTNDQGFVANDVETEQICHDAATLSLQSGRYTSYVQMRGSAPFFWSQDTIQGRITPKPQILVDRADPFFTSTAQHFNSLMSRYGCPIIILNLVKIKEKKPHEQILSGLLKESIEYLNQFLPPEFVMQYIAWDMARVTKSKEDKVIEILAEIAERVMKETGFFHSGPQLFCNKLRNDPSFQGMKGFGYNDAHFGLKQTGILRVNCVDCLDRTNTAQFMVGKCALGFQLHALGVTESPVLKFDSDAVRILEELYEAHGDTLALQYGGSQMVHRIRTYRKIAPWTSYSRDIMQTVSRYYSNAFTDMDKQQAINLFLGTFIPDDKAPNIWDIPTDYYLHHTSTLNINTVSTRQSYTKWLQEDVFSSLPFSWEEVAKKMMIENIQCDEDDEDDDEVKDVFAEYYRPSELTEFDSLYPKTMPTSTKDFMPTSSCDPSPFVVRLHGRAEDDTLQVGHRPIGGQPGLEESSDEGTSSDEEKIGGPFSPTKAISRDILAPVDYNMDNWPTFTGIYGINVSDPIPEDKELYQRYADISNMSTPFRGFRGVDNQSISWDIKSEFGSDSTIQVKEPIVDDASKKIYENYCQIGIVGPSRPAKIDADIYLDYVSKKYL